MLASLRLVCEPLTRHAQMAWYAHVRQAAKQLSTYHYHITPFATALSLGVRVENIQLTHTVKHHQRGPSVDSFEKAIVGFQKTLPSDAVCVVKNGYHEATWSRDITAISILSIWFERLLQTFATPHSMRFLAPNGQFYAFDRPIVAIFFHPPDGITMPEWCFLGYSVQFTALSFLAHDCYEKRIDWLKEALHTMATTLDGVCCLSEALVQQLASTYLSPTVIAIPMDTQWLTMPAKVIQVVLEKHQHMSVVMKDHVLLPYALAVLEVHTPLSQQGLSHALHARLQDAYFLYHKDKQCGLHAYAEQLKILPFHAKFGTWHDKITRLKAVACHLGMMSDALAMVLTYAKADLCSELGQEFPELYGTLGAAYAENMPSDVTVAIASHWRPLTSDDDVPSDTLGQCASLLDKIDTWTALVQTEGLPTTSRDPFGTRRLSHAIIRLLVHVPVTVHDLLSAVALSFDITLPSSWCDFFTQRIQQFFKVHTGQTWAVLSHEKLSDRWQCWQAYSAWQQQPEHAFIAKTLKRVQKLWVKTDVSVDATMYDTAERALYDACQHYWTDRTSSQLYALANKVHHFLEQHIIHAERRTYRMALLDTCLIALHDTPETYTYCHSNSQLYDIRLKDLKIIIDS
jgi:glycyl-tRNA synthetase beta subunit